MCVFVLTKLQLTLEYGEVAVRVSKEPAPAAYGVVVVILFLAFLAKSLKCLREQTR